MYELRYNCKEMKEAGKIHSPLNKQKPFKLKHGRSITYIEYDMPEEVWVAHCDEYGDVISWCPFCGIKLPTKVCLEGN